MGNAYLFSKNNTTVKKEKWNPPNNVSDLSSNTSGSMVTPQLKCSEANAWLSTTSQENLRTAPNGASTAPPPSRLQETAPTVSSSQSTSATIHAEETPSWSCAKS